MSLLWRAANSRAGFITCAGKLPRVSSRLSLRSPRNQMNREFTSQRNGVPSTGRQNIIVGLSLVSFVVGIYLYTVRAVKLNTELGEEFDQPITTTNESK